MGGCATKPRDVDGPRTLSSEDASNNVNANATTDFATATEAKVENKEEPLLDLSTAVAEEAPVLDGNASEEAKLADSLSELKPEEQEATTEVSIAQNAEKVAPEKTEEAAAEKIAEKIAEKVKEVADFVQDATANHKKETEVKKTDAAAEDSKASA